MTFSRLSISEKANIPCAEFSVNFSSFGNSWLLLVCLPVLMDTLSYSSRQLFYCVASSCLLSPKDATLGYSLAVLASDSSDSRLGKKFSGCLVGGLRTCLPFMRLSSVGKRNCWAWLYVGLKTNGLESALKPVETSSKRSLLVPCPSVALRSSYKAAFSSSLLSVILVLSVKTDWVSA